MMEAATSKKFEVAAKLRDKLVQIESLLEKQKISAPTDENIDIINYAILSNGIFLKLFQIRNGKLINEAEFKMKIKDNDLIDNEQVMGAF